MATQAEFDALVARVAVLETAVAALSSTVNLKPSISQVTEVASLIRVDLEAIESTLSTLSTTVTKISQMLVAQGKAIAALDVRVSALEG